MSTNTTHDIETPMTREELAAIKARYDNATGGAWYFEEQYGPHFLASEHHGYMQGIGDLIGFGDGEQADADRDFVQHAKQDMAALLDEVDRLRRANREDKRGRYLDNEGIGAGAAGNQLITWGGDVDQIDVRPSPHGGRVFAALGMLELDPYKSPETCPQVRFTLTDEHARQLADGIYASLGDEAGNAP